MFEKIRKRIDCIKYTLDHRKALQRLANEKGYSFPFHDLDKVFLYPFLGKHYTQILHRAWSRHHYRNGDIKDKVQAAFDWESARFTTPDKPLDAFFMTMRPYLRSLEDAMSYFIALCRKISTAQHDESSRYWKDQYKADLLEHQRKEQEYLKIGVELNERWKALKSAQ